MIFKSYLLEHMFRSRSWPIEISRPTSSRIYRLARPTDTVSSVETYCPYHLGAQCWIDRQSVHTLLHEEVGCKVLRRNVTSIRWRVAVLRCLLRRRSPSQCQGMTPRPAVVHPLRADNSGHPDCLATMRGNEGHLDLYGGRRSPV